MGKKAKKKRPTKREVAKAKAMLESLRRMLAPYAVSLTSAERKRKLRVRPGGEKMVEIILITAERAGLVLPWSVDDVRRAMAVAPDVDPSLIEARLVVDLLEDLSLESQHEAWYWATAYYTALLRLAAADREIEASIAPVVEFFRQGRRSNGKPDGDGTGQAPPEATPIELPEEPTAERESA